MGKVGQPRRVVALRMSVAPTQMEEGQALVVGSTSWKALWLTELKALGALALPVVLQTSAQQGLVVTDQVRSRRRRVLFSPGKHGLTSLGIRGAAADGRQPSVTTRSADAFQKSGIWMDAHEGHCCWS